MLEKALAGLPTFSDPRLLVGMETSDDAGVYRLTEDLALVQTVDYFTPIVDDPYTFGAIAVVNALSDVYSMGGTPRTALNLVLWDATLPGDALSEILRGGAETLLRAGCVLVGGHSVDAPELMFGVAVTGTVHPLRFVRNCDAAPGDALLLTKPLGVGILTTAAKYDDIPPERLLPAIDSMLTLNDVAASVMLEVGAHAATDITGFGLLGHAYEMAKGSGLAVEITASQVPVLEGVFPRIQEGTRTRAPGLNRVYIGEHLRFEASVPAEWQQLLLEAETSGGLLLAVPPDKAQEALERLHERGTMMARIVGRAMEGPPGEVRVLP